MEMPIAGASDPVVEPLVAREADDGTDEMRVILSVDVEEHHRIEAATGLKIAPELKEHYAERVGTVTRWLLERLGARGIEATFFIVGELAREQPDLVRDIHGAGHEVASHGWDHRRVLEMSPEEFREDVRRSVDILQQITGEPVLGYRAPTFSVVRKTAWAIDVLGELGLMYDSSVYPVRHDRYGVPGAPRGPFRAGGHDGEILEIPPATLRIFNIHMPVGGGGYFRLLPSSVMERALAQIRRQCRPPVAMLYFHPWEFDPDQRRLPLPFPNGHRTYVGVHRSRGRLERLVSKHRYARSDDVAGQLLRRWTDLPRHGLACSVPWDEHKPS